MNYVMYIYIKLRKNGNTLSSSKNAKYKYFKFIKKCKNGNTLSSSKNAKMEIL